MKIIRQSLSHMHLLTTVCVPMRLSHAITFLNWQQKMMNSSYQFLRQLWWYPRVSFSNMNRFPEKEGVLHLYLRKDPEMSTCTDSKTPVELTRAHLAFKKCMLLHTTEQNLIGVKYDISTWSFLKEYDFSLWIMNYQFWVPQGVRSVSFTQALFLYLCFMKDYPWNRKQACLAAVTWIFLGVLAMKFTRPKFEMFCRLKVARAGIGQLELPMMFATGPTPQATT